MSDLVNLGFRADTGGLTRAQNELDKTTVAGGRLDKQNSITTRSLGLVGTAIAAVGVTASLQQIIKYTDSWSNLNTQLRQVTSSEEQLLSVREQLLQVSRETRIDLSSTINLYAEMTRGTSELNLSSDKLVGITKTLNNLFLAGGKPLSEMTGAIRQLNQGFASGVLRGDEFNSVAEGAPRIMDALSASLGKTRGELREFAATGGITSKIMVDALESYSGNAQKLADTVKLTFEQTSQLISTNVTQFVGESEVIGSTVDALGGSLLALSENIEAAGYALGAAAGVVSISAIPAMTRYTTSLLSTAGAQLLAGTTAVKTSNALGVVTIQAAKATVATNALGLATKLLLGPVGLVIAAVGAAYFAFDQAADSMDKATESADKHAEKISRLEKLYSAMTEKQLGTTYIESQQRAIALDEQRLALVEKLESAQAKEIASNQRNGDARSKATNVYTGEVKSLESQLSNLDVEIGKNNESLSAMSEVFDKNIDGVKTIDSSLGKVGSTTGELAVANAKLSNSYAGQVLALQNQQLQLSMTADEFEVYGAVQSAIAYGANPAMTASIIEQVKALQSQRNAIAATNLELEGLMGGDLFGFGESSSGTDEFSDNLKSITEDIDSFGGAWSATGNIVVDAFGDMTDAMNDYASRMESIGDIQAKIDKQVLAAGDDKEKLAKIDIEQVKLNEERVNAELSGYRSLAEGSASLFSEKTAAAKAFTAISQVLAVTEIALSYQKMAASTVETGVVVANETTKQSANALTAITAAFAAPFPVGFVAGAAMIGIMASLIGGAFGGSGGSYEAPDIGGTGTVLGDSEAQSESILNAYDSVEDIEIDQLAELQSIRKSMTALSSGIEQLAKSFVSDLDFGDSGYTGELGLIDSFSLPSLIDKMPSFVDPLLSIADELLGGVIGSFSSTKKKLVDSGISFVTQTYADIFESGQVDASVFQVVETTKKKFWGLSKRSSTNAELTGVDDEIAQQIANVFGYIGDTVIEASDMLLGSEFSEQLLQNFRVNIGDISFKDKTGEEIQEELEAIFSQQADLMTNFVFPQLEEYQDIGEGLFETLIRVNQEQAIFNDAMERTGYEYSKFVTELEKIDFAQSIIDLTGGLEAFSELSNSFFESFYSDAEQFAYLEKSLGEAFDGLGLSMVGSREEFKELVNGIDITTEAGQQLYAMLLQLVPSMDDYLSALEEEEEERRQARIDFLRDEQSAIQDTANSLSSLINSINSELGEAFTIQQALAAARKGDFDVALSMTNQRVSSANYADPIEFARAQAIEANRLAQISELAGNEKTELERQIELIETQIDAINNGTDEIVNAIINLGSDRQQIIKSDDGSIELPPIKLDPISMSEVDTTNYNNFKRNEISELGKQIKNSDMRARDEVENNAIMNREIVKNTKTTAKILQRMEFTQEQLQ